MLHPLNPPNCMSQLNTLIGYQRQTLDYARSQTKYNDAGFCGVLNPNLARWLLSRKASGLKEDKVVSILPVRFLPYEQGFGHGCATWTRAGMTCSSRSLSTMAATSRPKSVR